MIPPLEGDKGGGYLYFFKLKIIENTF